MSNRKFIRRTFLAAAMTMSGACVTTASGFQQGPSQPGQPGQQIPQGNSTVTQELNRMFQESGQPMPSMNAQELPNANVPTQGKVRPTQPQNQTPNRPQVPAASANHAQPQQKGSSGKQGVLGKLFGKLRGDTGNNNPNYRPPVPPDYKPAAQTAAKTGNMQQPAQGPSQNSAQVHNGTASPIPPRSGATVRATRVEHPASSTPDNASERTQYTQPGSAPGFMSTAGAAKVLQKQPAAAPPSDDKFQNDFIRDNAEGNIGLRQKTRTTTAEVAGNRKAEEGFESPFKDSADSSEPAETLDLDSLIDIPAAEPQPAKAATEKSQSLAPIAKDAPRAAETLAEPANEFAESTTGEKSAEDTDPDATQAESNKAPEENPFTGVQLDTSDAEFFGTQEPTTGADVGTFGVPAAPMEDFNSQLPAIELPPVDLPPIAGEAAAAESELNATPAGESIQSAVDATEVKPAEPASAAPAADTAARAELPPSADVPKTMSPAETARLRQIAEQEQRQLQQRQIQARAGQTGFKGFCPVALRERRELVESSTQFTSTFGLQTYAFSSAESKSAFDTDPARYAPAAGGSDVVVLVNSGEEQAGQLDYALWYRDRLYLFRSRETMTLFSKDPQRFASQY
ncbi:MAG: hypothetical protein H7Z17_15030 [Fuerstia sp.]|nr:hypothetical protein [Fuerstiella sp.]